MSANRTPTPEQELLNRSRGNPPPAEVRSGQSLNALLLDLPSSPPESTRESA